MPARDANSMIREVQTWVLDRRDLLAERGFSITVGDVVEGVDNPSINIDFDSDNTMGRITVWSTGDCNMDVIEIDSEQHLMARHVYLEKDVKLDDVFREFLETM